MSKVDQADDPEQHCDAERYKCIQGPKAKRVHPVLYYSCHCTSASPKYAASNAALDTSAPRSSSITTEPVLRTCVRSEIARACSANCSTSKIVIPRSRSACKAPITLSTISGARPSDGSSSSINRGLDTSARAI